MRWWRWRPPEGWPERLILAAAWLLIVATLVSTAARSATAEPRPASRSPRNGDAKILEARFLDADTIEVTVVRFNLRLKRQERPRLTVVLFYPGGGRCTLRVEDGRGMPPLSFRKESLRITRPEAPHCWRDQPAEYVAVVPAAIASRWEDPVHERWLMRFLTKVEIHPAEGANK